MRTLFLTTILITAFCFAAFSQVEVQPEKKLLKIDTTPLNQAFKDTSLRLRDNKVFDYRRFLADTSYRGHTFVKPNWSDNKLKTPNNINPLVFKVPQPNDNMPVKKPGFNSPMPILVPDSTIKYHLLIK